jgi:hypothetical protein
VSRPPFFYGFKAYLTIGMDGMILPTGSFRLPRSPERLSMAARPVLASVMGALPTMKITFTPALPDWHDLAIGESRTLRFSIQFPSAIDACGGNVLISRPDASHALILLDPLKPEWAAKARHLVYQIEEKSDSVNVTVGMGEAHS